ncbi:MAG: glycosyltransferase family 4 protein [Streptomycetales bacterium]
MTRVLIDGRIRGDDGIGRYTSCLTRALRAQAGPGTHIEVLSPTGTPRYTRAEGEELLREARACGAALIHVLDYRVPLEPTGIPVVVTIHDVLRLVRPQFCYSDKEFAARFGTDQLAELAATTAALRDVTDPPPGETRRPESLHEEFYARMLALACARAAGVVTPSRAVARTLTTTLDLGCGVRVSPWGIDHLPAGGPPVVDVIPVYGRYLLYVGQARAHKGLETLLDAYERSRAPGAGVRLVCVGRDFTAGGPVAEHITARLDRAAVAVGTVDDNLLRELYTHAEALVHLAEHEGFGFTPLEALAAGTRVVASDIPVLRETLADHAHFTNPADPHAVAQAISGVIAAPDEPEARQRRMRWARRHRWSRHADDVLALYAEAAR